MNIFIFSALLFTTVHHIPEMIASIADLGIFMKRTLLNIQQPDESLNLAESALSFLHESKFVERQEGDRGFLKMVSSVFCNLLFQLY